MLYNNLYDSRWCGAHGIGRFAHELGIRIPNTPISTSGEPMSPLDPFRLSFLSFPNNTLFLSPGYNAPLITSIPYILTIHDLNHIDRPENSSVLKRLYYRFILMGLCRRAAAVLTVSEFSKHRIVEFFGIDPQHVFNVGNGVDETFSPDGEVFSVEGGYVLCVSNRRGHKNEEGLLKAFAKASLPKNLKLVLTGEESSSLNSLALLLGINDRMMFMGKVNESKLAALYRGATFMIFPSFYEGFGLPIIEAFASGTPVITSNVTAMPETAGDAALLVDPMDIVDIASAMSRLYDSSVLRNQLVERGLERVKSFTWNAVAEKVKNVLNLVKAPTSEIIP